ncbi:bacterial translation initiation factor 2 (bIF-2) [Desulfonauticus submarinus]|uniref:Translation initiation factor IF-2 n=1 Tax=Desulfonauticus submarinus TaxID=206665 RepID=A0A1H0AMH5_9BACT|nr:translation initiation factor IF-2 [Desulfonauticus submarinus]SDN34046.1 bacterial translation initiation factor 2 (bIF-2) [Desulfonauticus submarinus]
MAKKRVRDLAKELDVSTKEIIQISRELGIQVKSHMSGLTEEEITAITEKFKTKKENKEQIVKRKAPDGVIIRRRKQTKSQKKETTKEPTPDKEEKKIESKKSPEKKETREVKARIISTPKASPVKEKSVETEKKEKQLEIKPKDSPQKEEKRPKKEESKPKEKKKIKKRKRFSGKKEEIKPKVKVIARPEPKPEEPKKEESPKQKIEKSVASTTKPSTLTPPKETKEVKEKKKTKKKGKAGWTEKDIFEEKKKKKGKKILKEKSAKRVVDFSDFYEEEKEEVLEPIIEETPKPKETSKKKKTKGKKTDKKEDKPSAISTQPIKSSKKKIKIEEAIRVAELAQKMGVKAQDIIKILLSLGIMATINQSIDIDTASLVAAEFGFEVEKKGFSEEDYLLAKQEDKPEDLKPRPPVVTIMGHVDHGKTSLLDAIRKSNITAKEAGGITQHIGAYYVKTPKGDLVFLDTPGHEAFTAMRARGAQVTDIVILVVAADDGVMDQTREAINHAKAANVPIVVAVNKIDKEGANPERVKRELAELGLIPEDWGGETIFTEVSAKKRIGLDDLLEMVLLQAEVLELKANPNKPARGYIIEAKLDKGRGPVATVLIKEGTLHQGDAFVCGLRSGKIRAILNDQGKKLKKAGPSMPVEIQGIDGVPNAGEELIVVENEKIARKIAENRQTKQREKDLAKKNKITLESFLQAKLDGEAKNLNLVLKTDVQGSLEAVKDALLKLSSDEVKINIVHGGTGAISETDIMLAAASSAIIIGFNIRPTAKVKEVAEKENVEIRFYDIIYNLVNDIKDAMAGMLAPVIKEEYLGQAEVLQTFNVPKVGTVAGCMVVDGKLMRNAKIRLIRDGVVIYTGKLNSLKRFKDDVKEVQKGYECGVGLENYNDIKVGDIIEAFQEVEEKANIE